MDQPKPDRSSEGSRITLDPEMRPVAGASDRPAAPGAPRRFGAALPLVFGILGLVSGLAGLGAAGWLYSEGQAETRRLASEIAQLKVSLDLYARGNGQQPATSTGNNELVDLANRLAILEENWRAEPGPAPAIATTPAAAANEDCLPPGMRILVAEGDSYPVCGQPAVINVGQVANGYIMLVDGTTIASGGSILLSGGPCTIGVTSGGDEGLTGYAEIRVTC